MRKLILGIVLMFVFFVNSGFAGDFCKWEKVSKQDILELVGDKASVHSTEILEYQQIRKKDIFIVNEGGKYFVMDYGVKGKKYGYIHTLIFLNNGTYAYIARENNQEFFVWDGKISAKYDKISLNHIQISDKSFVFIGIKEGKSILVKDLRELSSYEGVFSPRYSYNNNIFRYIGKENGKQFIVCDSQKSEYFDKVRVYKTLNNGISYEVWKGNQHYYITELAFNSSNLLLNKRLTITKNKLNKSIFKKYTPKLEKVIGKLTLQKLKVVKEKLQKLDMKRYKKIEVLIEYLKAKVDFEIYNKVIAK